MCLVSQNMKDEALESQHKDKPSKHEKIKTLFALNSVPTTNKTIMKTSLFDQRMDMCYKDCPINLHLSIATRFRWFF
jgi:hypothetical protein